MNTNGWILLGTGSFTIGASSGNYIPISTAGPTGFVSAISVFSHDMNGQSGSEFSFKSEGVAPDRVLTIQWGGYRSYQSTVDNYNFHIKLYETSNEVRSIYGSFTKNTILRTLQAG